MGIRSRQAQERDPATRAKPVTHVLYNPTLYDIDITPLGLDPHQHGGRWVIKQYKDARLEGTQERNHHMLAPDEVILISSHIIADVKAVAPQLRDAGPRPEVCRQAGFGWLILPLTDLEQHLFISPAKKPDEFTRELMTELRKAGFFRGA